MFILAGCSIDVPAALINVVSAIINLIKIGVPLLLIIFGMLDLGKAVMAQKEDEIKKGQQTFMKRIIAAVLVFFVVFIVQLVVSIVSSNTSTDGNVWGCVEMFVNGGAKK